MNPPETAVSEDTYRLLLQAAMLGTQMGEISLAIDVAEALAELRPDLPHAPIVLAMSEFCAGRKDDGLQRLEVQVRQFPDDALSKAMLAVCLQDTGRAGWQSLLESVIDEGRDEHATGMACSLLGRTQELPAAGQPIGPQATPAFAMWV
ncbi:HrpB1 family type III secretion system apparatus protein [Piscinibacter terrae]|nr:HrpB1 family type III secretion system apparatus protein [Albitalea terrae]